MIDYIGIGKRIKFIRTNKLKITQVELAEKINSNETSISRLETGKIKSLDISILDKIAQMGNCSIDEIVYGFNDNKNQTIKKINYLLKVLNEKELDYHFNNILNITKLIHPDSDIRDLKTIRKEINQK